MISVSEALQLVFEQTEPLPAKQVSLGESLGLALDEDVLSDINSPPHDKSVVDGYAVRADDNEERTVLEEVAAGAVPRRAVTPGCATHIMTGAPIPEGADSVVMVERTERIDDNRVRVLDPTISVGQNIMRLGASLRKGEVVVRRGDVIRPVEIGLLSEVGHTRVNVIPRPRVAVLATGSELVEAKNIPTAGHLRNSNGPMLCAAVRYLRAEVVNLGLATDDLEVLHKNISAGFDADVLVTSGGVSAGTRDFVPRVFDELGVEKIFHRVQLKPGKPVWFGVKRSPDRNTLVFGLPGNPVSSLVCFELLVRPAINKLSGLGRRGLRSIRARLGVDFPVQGDREVYHPAFVDADRSTVKGVHSPVVNPVLWRGSGDLSALSAANALIVFPSGDHHYVANDEVDVLLLE